MPVKKMSFEGKIYHGNAGSEGTTEIGNVTEITETFGIEEGETTEKGTSDTAPVNTSRVTARTYEIQFTMYNKEGDTSLNDLRAAAVAGTPVAIRTKSYATGTGFDGDMILSWTHGRPHKGSQTYQFTGKPNDDERAPQLDV